MEKAQKINSEPSEIKGKHERASKSSRSSSDREKIIDRGIEFNNTEHSIAEQKAILSQSQSEDQKTDIVRNLQQTYGNAYVQRLFNSKEVQAKLTVSQPGDPYEVEADNVAKAVTQNPATTAQREGNPEEEEDKLQTKISRLQRQAAVESDEDEVQSKSSDTYRAAVEEEDQLQAKAAEVQREEIPEEEEEEPLQAKASGVQLETNDELENRINASKGLGEPLADSMRQSLEPRFGADFGEVKVHTGAEANTLSRQLKAEAFTTGKDIFFKEGRYQPDSEDGQKLIAHELTHVVQQGGASVSRKAERNEEKTKP